MIRRLATLARATVAYGLTPWQVRAVLLSGDVPRHGKGCKTLVGIPDFERGLGWRGEVESVNSCVSEEGPAGYHPGRALMIRSGLVKATTPSRALRFNPEKEGGIRVPSLR